MEQKTISCLDPVLQEVQSLELTQQIKLPDDFPDIGRILSGWGQVVLRSKQWLDGEASVSGGMLVWVLYAPEDGSRERCVDGWIPFQMKWDLPEDLPDGVLRVRFLTRFVDGRGLSPRKLMVRCGISAMAEGFVPMERQIRVPSDLPKGVELLESTYPLRLGTEAGEKAFLLEEELALPDSAPQPESLVYFRMEPRITDSRILGDKLAFRGNGNLHLLYRSEEGQLHSWDFPLPFSQIAELDREYGSDAQGDLAPVVTSLEAEPDDEGHIRLKGAISAQYRVTDQQRISLVEDAYVPGREVTLREEMLELPVVLETRRENLYGEQTLPLEVNLAADVSFLPDFPRESRSERGVELTLPGNFQVLTYGPDGRLQGNSSRWEGRQQLRCDADSHLAVVPQSGEPQVLTGSGQLQMKADVALDITTMARQRIPMVTGVEVGPVKAPDPNRPALILRRAGETCLWDLAKDSGSTVEAIRRANGLQGEPAPERMLLIPVV